MTATQFKMASIERERKRERDSIGLTMNACGFRSGWIKG